MLIAVPISNTANMLHIKKVVKAPPRKIPIAFWNIAEVPAPPLALAASCGIKSFKINDNGDMARISIPAYSKKEDVLLNDRKPSKINIMLAVIAILETLPRFLSVFSDIRIDWSSTLV